MVKPRQDEKPKLGGYASLKKVPTGALDYHNYLWVPKMCKGVPYLLVYETNRSGCDLGKEPINLGEIQDIEITPSGPKTTPAARRIANIDAAVLKSKGFIITVNGEDDKGELCEKEIYIMIGNIMDGELDEYYFPSKIRDNKHLLDAIFVKSMYSYINIWKCYEFSIWERIQRNVIYLYMIHCWNRSYSISKNIYLYSTYIC